MKSVLPFTHTHFESSSSPGRFAYVLGLSPTAEQLRKPDKSRPQFRLVITATAFLFLTFIIYQLTSSRRSTVEVKRLAASLDTKHFERIDDIPNVQRERAAQFLQLAKVNVSVPLNSSIFYLVPDGQSTAKVPWGPGSAELFESTRRRAMVSHRVVVDDKERVIRYDVLPRKMPDTMNDGERVRRYIAEWRDRVRTFRLVIQRLQVATSRVVWESETAVDYNDPSFNYYTHHGGSLKKHEIWNQSLAGKIGINASRPPNFGVPVPIVPMALVVPLYAPRVNKTWPFFESLLQLRTWPEEIVVMAAGMGQAEDFEWIGFLRLFIEDYLPRFPKGVKATIFGAQGTVYAAGNRYAGVLRTTSDLTMFFDCDDYLHPRIFDVLYSVASHDPTIDHLMFVDTEVAYPFKPWEIIRYVTDFLVKNLVKDDLLQTYAGSNHSKEFDFERNRIPKRKEDGDNSDPWYYGHHHADGGYWLQPECVEGWTTTRRRVFEYLQPEVDLPRGEDGKWNWAIIRSGFNLLCLKDMPHLGIYLRFNGNFPLMDKLQVKAS